MNSSIKVEKGSFSLKQTTLHPNASSSSFLHSTTHINYSMAFERYIERCIQKLQVKRG
jgi:hypothetical protein